MKNGRINWPLVLFFLLAANIYATPVNDHLEIAAQLCHFSDIGFRCSCAEQALEDQTGEKKNLKRARRECCGFDLQNG